MLNLLVVGGGPAGCAAAIQARRAGLSVRLIEARERAHRVPGETLHPGIEPLFEQLGIREAVLAARFHRHSGIWTAWDQPSRFQPYGGDERGEWFGFQADRERLQAILLDAVRRAGADVEQGAVVDDLIVDNGRVAGARVNGRERYARWTADATGRQSFVARSLRLGSVAASPPLRAQFGWREGEDIALGGEPQLAASADGWEWRAPLGDGRTAWVSLYAHVDAVVAGPRPGTDVSWRYHAASAGPGYFLLGDAAAILDPASSHGVLRAVMSGMLCAHLVHAHVSEGMPDAVAIARYREWSREQFDHDIVQLRELYGRHPSSRIAAAFTGWTPQPFTPAGAAAPARATPSCGRA